MTFPIFYLVVMSAMLVGSAEASNSTNGTVAVPISPSLPTNGSFLFCRNFGSFHETISVSAKSKKYINHLRSINVLEGPCRSFCSSICNKTSCLASATLAIMPNGRERCTCPSKCGGLKNVACTVETNTCSCKEGFWGTNVTSSGCPNRGFYVKPLTYKFSDLEPIIDNVTMFLHHQKHHQEYVDNLNKALAKSADLLKPIIALQANATAAGPTIRNNAGGHYNHALFWTIMAPPKVANTTKPSTQLASLIKSSFGNQFSMISAFNKLAAPASTSGSGWVWLCVNSAGTKLVIVNTQNQDNPLMVEVTSEPLFPILGLDVWEHAYYLKYNNLRDTYVANFWKLVNWRKVSEYAAYAVANKKGVSI